jgi:hypothetical protein
LKRLKQVQVTHAQNTSGAKQKIVKRTKDVMRSNEDGYHTEKVPQLAAGTMVVCYTAGEVPDAPMKKKRKQGKKATAVASWLHDGVAVIINIAHV